MFTKHSSLTCLKTDPILHNSQNIFFGLLMGEVSCYGSPSITGSCKKERINVLFIGTWCQNKQTCSQVS